MVVCNKGTFLAPLLFTVFSSASCHLQKLSDDSAIVGLITDDNDKEYRELIQDFLDGCQQNCLQINAGKRVGGGFSIALAPVNIQGKDTE